MRINIFRGDLTHVSATNEALLGTRVLCEQVFILSLRSGAVGINLTAANHIFMMEPVLNPALDDQAVGRAWRMGQSRKVIVKRLYVKGTIEEHIMACVKANRVCCNCCKCPCGLDSISDFAFEIRFFLIVLFCKRCFVIMIVTWPMFQLEQTNTLIQIQGYRPLH